MEPPQNNPDQWDDLKIRAMSGGVLLLVALMCLFEGGVLFISLVILAAVLMMKEWEALTTEQMPLLRFGGYFFIIIPSACLIWIRLGIYVDPNLGLTMVLALIAAVSATDMGCYFAGRHLGRHKLAPSISPGKTWEGLAGGVLCAMVVALLFSPYVHMPHSLFSAVFLGLIIALLAQAGDLLKSRVKRMAGVKDSGTLIPGHGGVLDRLDGYLLTAPLLALIMHHLTI